jgi:hypothetical protein
MTNLMTVQIRLLPAPEATADELSAETVALRHRLLELDIDDVRLARDREAPPGTKAVDATSIGHLLLTAIPATSILGATVAVLVERLKNPRIKSIKIEVDGSTLELTGVDKVDQKKVIDAWISSMNRTSNG